MTNSYENGTFIVGVDIAPGLYRAPGLVKIATDEPVRGYWARLSNFTGQKNILANQSGTGPFVVQILPTDKGFETRHCGPWTKIG